MTDPLVAIKETYYTDARLFTVQQMSWLIQQVEALRAQRQAVLDMCDAADEADLKLAVTDYEPIEVRWTLAVRAALGVRAVR